MAKIILIAFLCVMLLVGAVYAVAENAEPVLEKPFLLPDSPFYFLVKWSEGLGTLLAFGDEARAERYLKLADRRIAEVIALSEKGETKMAEQAMNRYQGMLEYSLQRAESARERGEYLDGVLTRITERTLYHIEVLLGVYEQVPEEAREGIERAMEVGLRGHEEAIKAVLGETGKEYGLKAEEIRARIEKAQERAR